MSNYFRITIYHPVHNISAIMDSNGKFEKLWQFSAYLVAKGFKIVEVGAKNKFDLDNLPKVEHSLDNIFLRSCKLGNIMIAHNHIPVKAKFYMSP